MIPRSEEVQRLTWAASQMVTREMPYTVLKGLFLKLVILTTNGAAAALTALQLANVLSDIRVKINGSDTRVSITGEMLYLLNYYDFSKAPASVIDTAIGSSKTQSITLYLPFALTRSVRPEDSVLDLRKTQVTGVSTAYMEVTFPAAAIGTDMTITSGYLYVQTKEYQGAGDKPYIAIHEMSYLQQALNQTGKNRIMLDVGGQNEYRRFLILCKNSSSAFSSVQIDKVTLKSRAFSWFDVDSELLRDANAQDYSITPQAGVYLLETTTDGKMSERLDAKKLDELVIELDSLVTNGNAWVLKEKVYYLGAA